MYYIINPLKKYADFSGRTSVKEFWLFFLFYFLIFAVLTGIDVYFDLWSSEAGLGVLGGISTLLLFLPTIAIQVRRLHDTGRSGWWSLIALVPFIGFVILMIFLMGGGMRGDNKYGEFPSAVEVDANGN